MCFPPNICHSRKRTCMPNVPLESFPLNFSRHVFPVYIIYCPTKRAFPLCVFPARKVYGPFSRTTCFPPDMCRPRVSRPYSHTMYLLSDISRLKFCHIIARTMCFLPNMCRPKERTFPRCVVCLVSPAQFRSCMHVFLAWYVPPKSFLPNLSRHMFPALYFTMESSCPISHHTFFPPKSFPLNFSRRVFWAWYRVDGGTKLHHGDKERCVRGSESTLLMCVGTIVIITCVSTTLCRNKLYVYYMWCFNILLFDVVRRLMSIIFCNPHRW